MNSDWEFLTYLTWTSFVALVKSILPAVIFVSGLFFLFFGLIQSQYELLQLIGILFSCFIVFLLGSLLLIVKIKIRKFSVCISGSFFAALLSFLFLSFQSYKKIYREVKTSLLFLKLVLLIYNQLITYNN